MSQLSGGSLYSSPSDTSNLDNVTGVLPIVNGGTGATAATGTGNAVLATSPTLVTPVLGVASATSLSFGNDALSVYDEGNWTPADNSGAGLSFTSVNGKYTRIGNIVIATCSFSYPVTASGANASISGLPFSGGGAGQKGGYVAYNTAATLARVLITAGGGAGTTASLYNSSGVAITNASLSTTAVYLQFIYHI